MAAAWRRRRSVGLATSLTTAVQVGPAEWLPDPMYSASASPGPSPRAAAFRTRSSSAKKAFKSSAKSGYCARGHWRSGAARRDRLEVGRNDLVQLRTAGLVRLAGHDRTTPAMHGLSSRNDAISRRGQRPRVRTSRCGRFRGATALAPGTGPRDASRSVFSTTSWNSSLMDN